MKKKVELSMANFLAALRRLEKFSSMTVTNDRDRAGVIQAFEFTFEVAWKTIQKAIEDEGLRAVSPKGAFKAAFQLGWILENEQADWIQLLEDRNLTSHTYREELANEIFQRIQLKYVIRLRNLFDRMEKDQVAD
ncbi:MAG: nucleotidyltransferase [Proteobacteria bacterium]|nr:nucleotidyltransferase [Pseudomonadota bacterium]